MADRVPEPWHKLHDEEYETAVAEGIGAMIGTCMGMGEDAPFMTDALHRGLRYMAASCFDRGYQTSRDEDHDCEALTAGEARGRQQVANELRNAVLRVQEHFLTDSAVVEQTILRVLATLDSIAKEGSQDGE